MLNYTQRREGANGVKLVIHTCFCRPNNSSYNLGQGKPDRKWKCPDVDIVYLRAQHLRVCSSSPRGGNIFYLPYDVTDLSIKYTVLSRKILETVIIYRLPRLSLQHQRGSQHLAASKNLSFILHFVIHSENIHGAETKGINYFHPHLPSLLRQPGHTS